MWTWKVYVIHFDKAYKHAKHYTGITKNVPRRMNEHKNGQGARLMQVLKQNKIGFKHSVIAEYNTFSEAKQHEKNLKTKCKQPSRYCPICKIEKFLKALTEIKTCDCGSLTYTGCICKGCKNV